MQNEQAICYITYAVPANMLPNLPIMQNTVSSRIEEEEDTKKDLPSLYPPGFMPDWFIRGSFPEDDFED